jgi:curved DNA-binding protein CbpA
MILQDGLSFYEILDLNPRASSQEIREAYIRSKNAFHQDNLASYSLITSEQREHTIHQVEEAYAVLSNPEKRRIYDQTHGLPGPMAATTPAVASVTSIDRVPPMENIQDGDRILIPPKTDFTQKSPPPSPPPKRSNFSVPKAVFREPSPRESRGSAAVLDPVLFEAIQMETEWRGSFLKKVREALRISIEEMSGITKVTKSYIIAIEEEDYSKLPAAVYIRGFIKQIAKVLKLPHDRVAAAYLLRYQRGQN